MPNTPNRGYPYPALSSPNDPPRDLQQLADAVDTDVHAIMTAAAVGPDYVLGWGDYFPSSSQYLGLVATRSASGLVGLSGMFARLSGGSLGPNTTPYRIATLPEGYRPARQILVMQQFGHGPGRVDILPDGGILVRYTASNTWTAALDGSASLGSLAGVSYVAAS